MKNLTEKTKLTTFLFFRFLGLSLGWGGLATTLAAASDQRPNIIFFFSDDLGYADLGCYGHPYAKTPTLDRLAREGTRFEQHYVTGMICNPSRTGLMTGIYPARFARYTADFGFEDRVTITEFLQKSGYKTGHFGKWHMGPKSTEQAGMYGLDVVQPIGPNYDDAAGRDVDLTSAAIEFLRAHAGEQPVYINIWGWATHFPINVPPELASELAGTEVRREDFSASMQHKFDECLQIGGDLDESMRQYLADVYSVDKNVKRVLDAIDELGIRDNTLFVYSSDHGPAPVILENIGAREFSKNMLGYAGIFRGGKHTYLEGGLRVPMIIRWPGRVPAGRVESESVTSFIDWMPTLASIAGIEELPALIEGEDVSDIWFGKSRKRMTPLYWRNSDTRAPAVMRDGRWKLHETPQNGAPLLYDLSADPAETRNVADANPEVITAMQQKVQRWKAGLPPAYERDHGRLRQQLESMKKDADAF